MVGEENADSELQTTIYTQKLIADQNCVDSASRSLSRSVADVSAAAGDQFASSRVELGPVVAASDAVVACVRFVAASAWARFFRWFS